MVEVITVSARIKLLRTEEGGRRTAIASGYRLSFKFGDLYKDAAIDLIDRDWLAPGEECDVQLRIPIPQYVEGYLLIGQTFDLTEGARKVGEGRITAVEE